MEDFLSTFNTGYAVNNKGECFSFKSGKKVKLNQYASGRGYLVVKPYIDGKNINMYVHRLVAEAFIHNPNDKPFVNHIDGDKHNNHADNLEWVTHSENMAHASTTGLMNNNKRSKPVVCFNSSGFGMWFPSTRQADRNGFSNECISRVCLGKSESHRGMKWEYCNDK